MAVKIGKSVLLGVCAIAYSSIAAPQANVANQGNSSAIGADEVVVTARKRDENLQEVPIAIDVLGDDKIVKLNLRDMSDISKYSPSVIFDQGFAAQDTRITIRGLAPTRGRQNVAVLVDGIDVTGQAVQTNGGSLLTNPRLFDVQRIEILKGPQNALYGRTAFAGAINYITRDPSKEGLDARAYVDAGNNERYDGRFSVSAPLVENKLYGGFNFAAWTDDGFYKNSVTGAGIGGREGYGISGTLSWDITDDFDAKLRLEYTDEDIEQTPYFTISPTTGVTLPPQVFVTPPGGTAPVLSPDAPAVMPSVVGKLPSANGFVPTLSRDPRTLSDYPGTDREVARGSLILDYDLGAMKIVSLTGLTDSKVFSYEDSRHEGDAIGRNVASEFFARDKAQQFSQELRLQSDTDSSVSWTIGALYWQENVDFTDGSVQCIFAPAPGDCGTAIIPIDGAARFPDLWERDTTHWSVYGLIDMQITDDWSLAMEGRYVDEDLTVIGPDRAGGPGPADDRARAIGPAFGQTALQASYGVIKATEDDDFFAPKVTVRWTPSDGAMYYGSIARAFKPAGIAIVAALSGFNPDVSRFDQEKLTAYELGAKLQPMENLLVNAAVFYQDFSDKQVSTQQIVGGSLASVPVNASSADVYGVELEYNWAPTDGLEVFAAYTYLNTEYDSFSTTSTGAGAISRAGNCTVRVETTVSGPRSVCDLDLSGGDLEFVPQHSLLAGFEYRRALRDGMDWILGADYVFQDNRYLNPENTIELDSYSTLDLRLGVAMQDWDALLYIANALEDDTIKSSIGSTQNGQLAVYGPPFTANPPFTFWLPSSQNPILPDEREIGVRLSYRFGG